MIALTRSSSHDQRGVVSIFIVIFSAIFMTIITVSFLSVMTHDQKQATQNNLSQNAYDSAMAGVEDAKRAIVKCEQNQSAPGCDEIKGGSNDCDMLSLIGINQPQTGTGGNSEYPLQQSEGANTLNQAYTCVMINSSPEDYKADLTLDTPLVIPLESDQTVNSLLFKWQPNNDLVGSGPTTQLPISGTDLLPYSTWRTTKQYPSVIRLQLVRLTATTNFSDLDGASSETVFLYPNKQIVGGPTTVDFSTDKRRVTSNLPKPVGCDTSTFVCTATLRDNGKHMTEKGSDGAHSLYLIMTPLYNNTSITLSLSGAASFQGIQAVVDSTGRANDVFRRVQARIDLIPHPSYPDAALSLKGSLCKNFIVTPKVSDYSNNATAPDCGD